MPLESSLFYGRRPSQATPTASTSSSSAPTSKNTPSPFHTSRIPAPPSATSSSSSSSSPSSNRTRRRPAASSTTSKISPANFKLHFAGRVYRPFAHTSPPHARKSASASSSPHSRPLLGQPDELVKYAQAVVDCPCKRNVDDSTLMVQCEDCDVWVHARCVGFETEDDCPEQYHCRKCAPAAYKRMRQSTPTPNEQSKAREARSSHSARPSTPPPSSLRSAIDPADGAQRKVKDTLPSRVTPPASEADSDDEGELEIEQPSLLSNPAGSSPLSRTPPRTQQAIRHHHASASPSRHSVSRNLLSELANASPIIKASQSHPLLTPTKRKARTAYEELDSDANSSRSGKTANAPHSRIANTALDPATVPLPDHYASLLSLHSAVERALLLHLATEGSKACSATIASASDGSATSQSSPSTLDGTLAIDMPNLATYTGVRAVVERGANKRFGPTELAQLVWLWEGGLYGPRATEDGLTAGSPSTSSSHDGRRGGLSLTVSAARELDRAKGKKVYTWGIGIRLELKQNVQLPALEVVDDVPAAVAAATLSSTSSSSPSTNKLKRYGLSMLPLWSSKAEWRREEVRRRLGECVLRAHANFTGTDLDLSEATPSKRKKVPASGKREESPAYTLPTPPPSHRKQQHSHGRSGSGSTVSTSTTCFVKGFILDALPPIPAATLPSLGPASTASLSAPPLLQAQEKERIANADMADVAAAERLAMQITTKDLSAYTARAGTNEGKRDQLLSGQRDSAVKAAPEQRAMSLLERIKAKEAAQAQAAQTTSQSSGKGIGNSRQRSTARSAALSSLEAASARAKRREITTDARSRNLL